MNNTLKFLVFLLASVCVVACAYNNNDKQNESPAPLFVDPNYQGSCDPEIVWNELEQQWYIYYTARRPMLENTWLQTPIGVAVSKDMIN